MTTRALVYETELRNALVDGFKRAKVFKVAVALVTIDGLHLLIDEMRFCLKRGGKGELVVGVDLPSHPDALATLMELRDQFPEALSVKYFKSPAASSFHPKFYVFESRKGRRCAVAGSSNMTTGGLQKNYEASIWLNDPEAVNHLADYFTTLHDGGHAHCIDGSWLKEYWRLWKERQRQQRAAMRWRERVRTIPQPARSSKTPKCVRGNKFVFTGAISEWPRKRRLYPLVKDMGGLVGQRASALPSADCLVQGDRFVFGKLRDKGAGQTLKLKDAKKLGVPIISGEEFILMLELGLRAPRG